VRYGNKSWVIAVSTAAVTAVLFSLFESHSAAPAQAPAQSGMPRTAGKPDFSGIWQANNTAYWDLQTHAARPMVGQPGFLPNSVVLAAPVVGLGSIGWVPAGLGVVEGEEIPYLPWAATRKKENLEHWMDRDPEIKCFQPGIPRAMYMPHPFQIIQSATKVMMVFEFANAERTIHLNKMDDYPNVAYMGYSVGRWEGDTLIVDSAGFNDKGWLDVFGHIRSEALRVTERFQRRDFGHMEVQITVDDAKGYTRPWTVTVEMAAVLDTDLLDAACWENEKDAEHLDDFSPLRFMQDIVIHAVKCL